jgi:hypothetical protein
LTKPWSSVALALVLALALGILCTPVHSQEGNISAANSRAHRPPESELIFEGLGSLGHFHVFAYSWWSYLDVGGLEYDRHSWDRFLGARRDYVAEILPVAILRQPTKTDVFGDPLSKAHKTNVGVGISPVGMRLIWRDGKNWKPYYTIKGGLIIFSQKSISEYASYQNFSLQQALGVQFKVTSRWDFRMGVGDFHFSNAFMVPSNPGIDEMSYNGGICFHLGKPASR